MRFLDNWLCTLLSRSQTTIQIFVFSPVALLWRPLVYWPNSITSCYNQRWFKDSLPKDLPTTLSRLPKVAALLKFVYRWTVPVWCILYSYKLCLKKNAYRIHCKVCMYTIVFSSGVFLEFMTPPSLVDLLCSKPELALPNYRLLQPVLRSLDEAHLETLAQVFDPSRNPLKGHLCRFMGSRHR